MSSELVRFSVAMPEDLLMSFESPEAVFSVVSPPNAFSISLLVFPDAPSSAMLTAAKADAGDIRQLLPDFMEFLRRLNEASA